MQSPETSFQRANRLADEAKARKRREYEAMRKVHEDEGRTLKDMYTDFDLELAPIVRELPEAAMFVKWVRVFPNERIQRPTERLAFRAARGEDGRDRLVIVRQQPATEYRYCLGCKTRHAVSEFDWNKKRTPPGYRWYCRRWLRLNKVDAAA